MRRQASLEQVIGTYRLVFIGVAALVLAMGVISALGFLYYESDARAPELLAARVAAGATLLLLLRWGFVRLKQELQRAADEQRRLLDFAYQDALTGAHTRSYFFSALRENLHGNDRPVAYMQIDMDNLKVLNDSQGHAAGDSALVHLVKTLKTLMPDALIGRLGGDEFGIVLVGQDSKPALVRLGDRILQTLGQPISIEGRPIRLSATIGVALWPQDAAEADELISKADLALYKGKKQGRASTVAFESELMADERHKRFVERDLRAAILLNELELHYQPIFAADGVTRLSYEALVRWQHPVRGRVPPCDFIGIAEQSDLIDKLGDWVLRRACADLGRLGTPNVGINVSVVQLRRGDLAERFTAILKNTGTKGSQIVIEITESLPLQPGTVELDNIDTLRALGVRVAIDDFGTGFASLEYLRGFPFDIIKIDRSNVMNLPGSRIDGLIVSAISKIARSLKVEVIAEGVETEAQLLFLQRVGVTALQGYLLARPEPLAMPRLASAA
ncbi:bifunctional diguanylate cyclase/phosphodiesterase [Devosia sp.]|uniref:putative bifunctional diguanylate cyclase/phosphodiesterase n=1 Tax=Devosia sp. TaxID=1871048 RepID=UPI0026100921|nr:bifunctional diguanylate cyclase/phosphodiesterase [Devosia sp.]